MKFYNISNHPSSRWSTEQKEAALKIGSEIVDIAFPQIRAEASMDDVHALVNGIYQQIPEGSAVMVQGEFSFVLSFVALNQSQLKPHVIYVGCSERNTVENEDGSKTSVFEFVQFRRVQ